MQYQFNWDVLYQYRVALIDGVVATLILAALSSCLSFVAGVSLALLESFATRAVARSAAGLSEFARNVPPVVQVFFIYFGFGGNIFVSAILGISIYASAQICETVRAGIRTLPKTQMEAAMSSGMNGRQYITFIVMPQALCAVIQPLASRFVNILKNTSLAMTVGYAELTFQTREIETLTFRGFEAITGGMVLYVLLGSVLLLAFGGLDQLCRKRMGKDR